MDDVMFEHAAINLRLAQLGLPVPAAVEDSVSGRLVAPLLARQRELSRRLADRLCAADGRIQNWLDGYLADTGLTPQLPKRTLVLDEPGLARELSLPRDADEFRSPLLSSYRLVNGVLHNPANDRRTTAGVFHIAEGGLPIPDDKYAVPKEVFARLLELAFTPPEADKVLPYAANAEQPAACFASLLLRPLVAPAVPGWVHEKRMEIRFIVPGGLVANLDFVEGIFGNGGDPYLPENDASLAPETWTGHTGAVILAPHLTTVTKASLGLPHISQATDRQRRDGMCWESPEELYNGGQAFKVCARDAAGVIVTVIADNYFGYCKKEVKTQISYSANLFGNAEEEHAGGALVFPSYNLGQEYTVTGRLDRDYSLQEVIARNPERFQADPSGFAGDIEQPHIVLVPLGANFSLRTLTVTWTNPDGSEAELKLRADKTYLTPDGYQVRMVQQAADRTQWSLIGTSPRATSCHKPSTVSGGGKSEISKAITDAFIFGNAYTPDIESDLDAVAAILEHDFSHRFADSAGNGIDQRPILSDHRSIGSVIKLLTPSERDYNPAYNQWLESIPQHVRELVYVVKRFYRPEWGTDWRSHFTVGIINGRRGNNLRLDGDKIMVNMLRVGFDADGSWRLFGLRHDFAPATKVQTEDDITASVVVAGRMLGLDEDHSYKVVENCEELLFQRPDDAIHRGYDKQTEADIAAGGTFLSNFEPLTRADAIAMRDDAVAFSQFTEPMRTLISNFADAAPGSTPDYFVCSANPRLVDGKPSKNPRYLQRRPDRTNAQATATAELAARLVRRLPADAPLALPVDIVAAGRRNNPPDGSVPPLCAFNPLHFLELPELFMEFISSMTGKSPSTTGAGSEGAMTKGPFNAMPAVLDLNAALLAAALTGYDGWVSCAGYVGPQVRVDHDISMLVPEVFSRMWPQERSAASLIAEGALERLTDFEFNGAPVLASRLGYRMTQTFARKYFGRIFLHPHAVFTEGMLRPEEQDPEVFATSMATMVTTHQRVAQAYFDDGTVSLAIPPLKALLEIMATGTTAEGWDLETAEFRALFGATAILDSQWYADRLDAKQSAAAERSAAGLAALQKFASTAGNDEPSARLDVASRIAAAEAEYAKFSSAVYRAGIVGTVGRQPL
jgi:phosphoenolpyruvate carboxykinase (diphosphate)